MEVLEIWFYWNTSKLSSLLAVYGHWLTRTAGWTSCDTGCMNCNTNICAIWPSEKIFTNPASRDITEAGFTWVRAKAKEAGEGTGHSMVMDSTGYGPDIVVTDDRGLAGG